MKKIFTTLFLFCFMFSYVFCMPSLAYTYQAQPIVLNDNIIALGGQAPTTVTTNSTQLYQNINGVFVPVNTTQVIPTTQYQQTTTTTAPMAQYQPAPVIVQPEPQPVYTQTTVTETVIEEKPSLGSKIAAGIFGTLLIGGLITLAALDDGPSHHHGGGGPKGHSGGHGGPKPPHRR